jgi:hypothetical protein
MRADVAAALVEAHADLKPLVTCLEIIDTGDVHTIRLSGYPLPLGPRSHMLDVLLLLPEEPIIILNLDRDARLERDRRRQDAAGRGNTRECLLLARMRSPAMSAQRPLL